MKLLYTLAIAAVLAFAAPIGSYAASSGPAPTAGAALPSSFPYTFVCPHCDIKITIKSKDEWTKACAPCPCGTTNAGCFHAMKKK